MTKFLDIVSKAHKNAPGRVVTKSLRILLLPESLTPYLSGSARSTRSMYLKISQTTSVIPATLVHFHLEGKTDLAASDTRHLLRSLSPEVPGWVCLLIPQIFAVHPKGKRKLWLARDSNVDERADPIRQLRSITACDRYRVARTGGGGAIYPVMR